MLDFAISNEGDVNVVFLKGELDATTSQDVCRMLEGNTKEGIRVLVLDMEDVAYVSSNGLRPLVEWLEEDNARILAACNLNEFTREVFRATEVDATISVYRNSREALNAIHGDSFPI